MKFAVTITRRRHARPASPLHGFRKSLPEAIDEETGYFIEPKPGIIATDAEFFEKRAPAWRKTGRGSTRRWCVLIANVLTVTFIYCFAKISQKEVKGEERVALPICGCSSSSS